MQSDKQLLRQGRSFWNKHGLLTIVIAIAVVVVGIPSCGMYNTLSGTDEFANLRWSEVGVQYQRRLDLIPNLVKVAEAASQYEKSVLTEVTKARQQVMKFQPSDDSLDAQKAQYEMSSAISRLLVVFEKYPDLKAVTTYENLMTQIEGTENRIAVARDRYQKACFEHNNLMRKLHYKLVSWSFKKRIYYEPEAGAEKAPKVEFSNSNPMGGGK